MPNSPALLSKDTTRLHPLTDAYAKATQLKMISEKIEDDRLKTHAQQWQETLSAVIRRLQHSEVGQLSKAFESEKWQEFIKKLQGEIDESQKLSDRKRFGFSLGRGMSYTGALLVIGVIACSASLSYNARCFIGIDGGVLGIGLGVLVMMVAANHRLPYDRKYPSASEKETTIQDILSESLVAEKAAPVSTESDALETVSDSFSFSKSEDKQEEKGAPKSKPSPNVDPSQTRQPKTQRLKAFEKAVILSNISQGLFGAPPEGTAEKWISAFQKQSNDQTTKWVEVNQCLEKEIERYKKLEESNSHKEFVFRTSLLTTVVLSGFLEGCRLFIGPNTLDAKVTMNLGMTGIVFLVIAAVAEAWRVYSLYSAKNIYAGIDHQEEMMKGTLLTSIPSEKIVFTGDETIAKAISTIDTANETARKLEFLKDAFIHFTTMQSSKAFYDSQHGSSKTYAQQPLGVTITLSEKKSVADGKWAASPKNVITPTELAAVVNVAYDIQTSDMAIIPFSPAFEAHDRRASHWHIHHKFSTYYTPFRNLVADYALLSRYAVPAEDLGAIRKARALGTILSVLAKTGLLTDANLEKVQGKQEYLYQIAYALKALESFFPGSVNQKRFDSLVGNAKNAEAVATTLAEVHLYINPESGCYQPKLAFLGKTEKVDEILKASTEKNNELEQWIEDFSTAVETVKDSGVQRLPGMSESSKNAENTVLSQIQAWPQKLVRDAGLPPVETMVGSSSFHKHSQQPPADNVSSSSTQQSVRAPTLSGKGVH